MGSQAIQASLKKGRGEKRSAVNGILRAEQVVLLRAW